MRTAAGETDLRRRAEMLAEVERLLLEEEPVVPLLFYESKNLVSKRVPVEQVVAPALIWRGICRRQAPAQAKARPHRFMLGSGRLWENAGSSTGRPIP